MTNTSMSESILDLLKDKSHNVNSLMAAFGKCYNIYNWSIEYEPDAAGDVTFSISKPDMERLMRDTIITKAALIDISDNKVIVLKYPLQTIPVKELCQLINGYVEQMRPTRVLAIPEDMELISCSVEELIDLKSVIERLIEASDYDQLVESAKH